MTHDQKYDTVIQKNTFYFYDTDFEQAYEGKIDNLTQTMLVLKNEVETKGLKKEIFENLLKEKENGLKAILALTGFSEEALQRLITIARIVDNQEFATLLNKSTWADQEEGDITEWGKSKITNLLKNNEGFRQGIVNLFFEGGTVPFLSHTLPLFELKKLNIAKLKFETTALIDTIARYKEKGSRSGIKENNAEEIIREALKELGVSHQVGDLEELIKNAPIAKRTMDFIIPNKQNPQIIIESSFLSTTSSGQGDKAKTEVQMAQLIKTHYPNVIFVGFVDGIAWYVRKGDMKRMVSAFDAVFTFHADEINRFKQFLQEKLV
jgi:hypothetical protein